MRVLRIEDAEGYGMYRAGGPGGSAWTRAIGCVQDDYAHPLPVDDSGLTRAALGWLDLNRAAARFGFTCLAQLRRWLFRDDWVRALSDYGCVLVEYEVDDRAEYFAGHTQVIFNIRYAVEVSRVPLDSILN